MFDRAPLGAIESALSDGQPDLVGLSVRNIDNNDMRDTVFFLNDLTRIVNLIRSGNGAPIILGGAALGVMPEQILRLTSVAYAVVGNGEMVFPLLLERISSGKNASDIPGVAAIENGVFHRNSSAAAGFLTTCPAPDYHRWLNQELKKSMNSQMNFISMASMGHSFLPTIVHKTRSIRKNRMLENILLVTSYFIA